MSAEKTLMASEAFESEMDAELEARVHEAQLQGGMSNVDHTAYYDPIYFDSDDDDVEGEEGNRSSKRSCRTHKKVSDVDLFYDPAMDDDDEEWMNKQRVKKPSSSASVAAKSANSDAVLNCPACFVLLCLDCQRHEIYTHQYRAMFVHNCSVDRAQKLTFPLNKKAQRAKKGKKGDAKTVEDNEIFHPVRCDQCRSEVGVMDVEEVYHFFNVLASH